MLAPISGRLKILGWVFFVLVIVQILLASFSESAPLVAALHPTNAMILFGMNIFLILRVRQIRQRS